MLEIAYEEERRIKRVIAEVFPQQCIEDSSKNSDLFFENRQSKVRKDESWKGIFKIDRF
jgi:hypothetical protein